MIDVRSLQFSYPGLDFSLDIPELRVERGSKVAVIGSSGCGKTTLLKLIAGIDIPPRGRIRIGDTVINDLGEGARRRFRISRIGFVFQDFELIEYLDVFDNIVHPFRVTRALKLNAEVRERACTLAQEMGIGDRLQRNVDELSQGEKQRTAICRALLHQPDLVLADEATGNLDPENKVRILDLLFRNVDRQNGTLVAVTHDHDLLTRFDRVLDLAELSVRS